MSVFDDAFEYLIGNEGTRFVDDPSDSGGATKYGITGRTLSNYFGRSVMTSEVENMSEDLAKAIYQEDFWVPLSLQKIRCPNVAVAIFDTAVLYGQKTAALLAQKAADLCGCHLQIDGVLGEQSILELNCIDADYFIDMLHAQTIARIETVISMDPKNEKFRLGWTMRASRLLTLKDS